MEDMFYNIIGYLPFVLMVFISLPVHEFAHGYIANKLGDDTAYYQGRLTLNPFAHLDLFGTISLIVFGYGWAKPVPVNPMRFKCNMRLGMALTSLAGPASNLILSFIFMVFLKLTVILGTATENTFFYFLNWIFYSMCIGNVGLAFFNLLPIPPLDGSRILNYFLPYKAQAFMDNLERYSQFIILGLLLVSRTTGIISTVVGFLSNIFLWVFDKMTFFLGEAVYFPIQMLLNNMI